MNSREYILGILQKAKTSAVRGNFTSVKDKDVFKDYPQQKSDLLKLFSERFQSLSGELLIASNLKEASKTILKICASKPCLTYYSEKIINMINQNTRIADLFIDIRQRKLINDQFAGYEFGLTQADYLIARTGSIVLNSGSAGGRRLSVLPPNHIVLAFLNQLVPSLDDIFKHKIKESGSPSYMTIISGPSRTSDIEKQLVLGAHGPKRLILILVND